MSLSTTEGESGVLQRCFDETPFKNTITRERKRTERSGFAMVMLLIGFRGDGRGEISIFTAYRHGVRVRSSKGQTARGAPLEVRVLDNGPGVPPHLRESLFQPFVTTKSHGVGLGLALVAKLVAAHGGLIDFESEPGRTVFRVLLPIASEKDLTA